MTPAEHYRRAEDLLAVAELTIDDDGVVDDDLLRSTLDAAQVHATLATCGFASYSRPTTAVAS